MTAGEPGDIVYEQRTPRYAGFSENDLVEKPATVCDAPISPSR